MIYLTDFKVLNKERKKFNKTTYGKLITLFALVPFLLSVIYLIINIILFNIELENIILLSFISILILDIGLFIHLKELKHYIEKEQRKKTSDNIKFL